MPSPPARTQGCLGTARSASEGKHKKLGTQVEGRAGSNPPSAKEPATRRRWCELHARNSTGTLKYLVVFQRQRERWELAVPRGAPSPSGKQRPQRAGSLRRCQGRRAAPGSRLRPRRRLRRRQCRDSDTLRLPFSDQTSAGCGPGHTAEAPGAVSTHWRLDGSPGSQVVPGPQSQFPVGKVPGAPREEKKLPHERREQQAQHKGRCLPWPVSVPAPRPLRRSLSRAVSSALLVPEPAATPLPGDDRSTWGQRCSGPLPQGAEPGPPQPRHSMPAAPAQPDGLAPSPLDPGSSAARPGPACKPLASRPGSRRRKERQRDSPGLPEASLHGAA